MKQTAVEFLMEKLKAQGLLIGEIDNLVTFQQAKELEKQQLEKVWKASEQNMRSQFSSSHYKNVTFEEWLEKNK